MLKLTAETPELQTLLCSSLPSCQSLGLISVNSSEVGHEPWESKGFHSSNIASFATVGTVEKSVFPFPWGSLCTASLCLSVQALVVYDIL